MQVTEANSSGPIAKFLQHWAQMAERPKGEGYYHFIVELENDTKELYYLGVHPNMESAVADARQLYPEFTGTVVGPLTMLAVDDPAAVVSDNPSLTITFELSTNAQPAS